MAEIMLLVLFILLLVLGAIVASRESAIHLRDQRIVELSALEHLVREQLRENKSGVTVEDIIQRIERDRHRIQDLEREVAEMRPYRDAGKALEDVLHEIHRAGGKGSPQEIAKDLAKLAQAERERDNLQGQVTQLTNQIKASGKGGNEFPSCWVTANGKIQSIFELVITGSGIQVHDRHVADRAGDEAKLPLSDVHYDADLPVPTFLVELRPLFDWSVTHRCRFYVIMYSSVTDAPIQSVNAANDFFYPDSRIQFRPVQL